jgi:hypothetical protein
MILAFVAALAFAGAPPAPAPNAEADSWDVIATMAAALAEPNEYAFMKPIAKSLEEHDLIERQVRVLVHTNDVVSSISPVTNEGDDKQRTLEVDWYLEIHPHSPGQSLIQRRENVKLVMVKTGKRWMITSLLPVAFFTAPSTN